MLYVVVILLLAALGLWALGHFAQASPAVLARRLRLGGGAAALGLAGVLALRGNLALALPVFSVGTWLLWGGGLSLPGRFGGSRGPAAGQTSTVRTEHLEMQLDHATGAMHGRVLKGYFAGRELDRLKPVELAHLWQDCRFSDPHSAQLVEAYLDRVHASWREDLARAEAAAPKGPDGRMTRAEALEILGLAEGAGPEEIREAHRKLMLRVHPDRGGSTYLAAKINEAKDVALGG